MPTRKGSASVSLSCAMVSFNGAASLPTRKGASMESWSTKKRLRFNGAASLPTRKARTGAVLPAMRSCFNGAASLPTRKAARRKPLATAIECASMGPRRCRRGRSKRPT